MIMKLSKDHLTRSDENWERNKKNILQKKEENTIPTRFEYFNIGEEWII